MVVCRVGSPVAVRIGSGWVDRSSGPQQLSLIKSWRHSVTG